MEGSKKIYGWIWVDLPCMDVWNNYREQFVRLNTSVLRTDSSQVSVCVYVFIYMVPDVLLVSNESPLHLVDLPSLPFPTQSQVSK